MSCGRDRIITNYDMSGTGRLFGTSICTRRSIVLARGMESVVAAYQNGHDRDERC